MKPKKKRQLVRKKKIGKKKGRGIGTTIKNGLKKAGKYALGAVALAGGAYVAHKYGTPYAKKLLIEGGKKAFTHAAKKTLTPIVKAVPPPPSDRGSYGENSYSPATEAAMDLFYSTPSRNKKAQKKVDEDYAEYMRDPDKYVADIEANDRRIHNYDEDNFEDAREWGGGLKRHPKKFHMLGTGKASPMKFRKLKHLLH